MDDAARVQGRERSEHSERERHRFGRAERPAAQPLGQDFTLEQLHRDVQLPVLLADFVDLADVRVVDARRGAGLAPEALAGLGIMGERGQRLQRDRTFKPTVARGIDDAHAALAKLPFDRVAPDARREGSLGRGRRVDLFVCHGEGRSVPPRSGQIRAVPRHLPGKSASIAVLARAVGRDVTFS